MRFINRPMRDRQSGIVAESIIKTKRADSHVKEQSTKDLSLSVNLTIGAKLRAGENQSPPHAREDRGQENYQQAVEAMTLSVQ